MSRFHLLHLVALTLGVAVTGCGPTYEYLDFEQRTSPPAGVTLSSSQVTIPAGIAVAVNALPMDEGEMIEDLVVDIASSNTSVLGVDPAYPDGFVIYGVSPGAASILITVDGQPQRSIPATVVAPE